MAKMTQRVGMKLLQLVISIPVGIVTKRIVDRYWQASHPEDPARSPADPRAHWRDALAWAAVSAMGLAVSRLVTAKGAAAMWRMITGKEPPELEEADESAEPQEQPAS